MRTIFVFAILFGFRALAEDPQLTSLVKQGDVEDRLGHTKAALTFFQQAETLDPHNVGVLLREAKQYSDLVDDAKAEEATQLAEKSLEYSKRAIELDPHNAKGHLSIAIAYGRLTDFVSNKVKVEYSKIIRDETSRSIEIDPTDDFAWYVLGRWNFGVANVNAVLKLLAHLVYGGIPAASNEEAARCLRKAIELAPQRIMHHGELARVYQAMGKKDLAMKEWQAVLALPASDPDEEKEKRDAQTALGSKSSGADRSAAR